MPTFCGRCGTPSANEQATFCAKCGSPIAASQQAIYPSFSAMQRTESTVIQVAPSYENFKIGEMQLFGWNLQGRQEIHEEGDAYGRQSEWSNTYVITTHVSHYVKLHFARSLALPNLEQIRRIETEYYNLPFPSQPSYGCATGLLTTGLLIFGISLCPLLAGLSFIANPQSAPKTEPIIVPFVFTAVILVVSLVFFVGGYVLVRKSREEAKEARSICSNSARRVEELKAELARYI